MEFLDLSYKNISGEIPKSLESLVYLKYLNLSFNELQGEIPSGGPFANFSAESFIDNFALCGASHLQVPPCSGTDGHGKTRTKHLLLYICLPIVASMLLLVIIAYLLITRRRRRQKALNEIEESIIPSFKRLSYQELFYATDGFEDSNLLGIGGYGSVYKGVLSDGLIAAVKVFNLQLQKGLKSFEAECEVMCNLRHRNLVQIISVCSNFDFKALIL